jgi:hypothetical protein
MLQSPTRKNHSCLIEHFVDFQGYLASRVIEIPAKSPDGALARNNASEALRGNLSLVMPEPTPLYIPRTAMTPRPEIRVSWPDPERRWYASFVNSMMPMATTD